MRMLNHKKYKKIWHHVFKRSNLQIVILYGNFVFNSNTAYFAFSNFEKGISYLSLEFLQTSLRVIQKKLGLLQHCQEQYYL